MAVYEGCYDVNWAINERRRNNHHIELNFPKSDKVEGITPTIRKEKMAELLMDRTKSLHKEFLEGIGILYWDYEAEETWHSEFNIHEVPDIE